MTNKNKEESSNISPTIIAIGFGALTLTTLITWKIYTSNFFKNNNHKINIEDKNEDKDKDIEMDNLENNNKE